MEKMFEVARELKKKFPDDEAKYREAYPRVGEGERLPAGRRARRSSITSTTS